MGEAQGSLSPEEAAVLRALGPIWADWWWLLAEYTVAHELWRLGLVPRAARDGALAEFLDCCEALPGQLHQFPWPPA